MRAVKANSDIIATTISTSTVSGETGASEIETRAALEDLSEYLSCEFRDGANSGRCRFVDARAYLSAAEEVDQPQQ